MTRHDITPEAVAKRWLAGETIAVLAVALGASEELIKRRIRTARQEFPDLPWDERVRTQNRSAVRDYRNMKDGVSGTRTVKQGSIVFARRGRR